jgi:hypothetical protein
MRRSQIFKTRGSRQWAKERFCNWNGNSVDPWGQFVKKDAKQAGLKTTKIMENTYVPLISSGVAGPLGVIHLPRLWLKSSLEARGKLAAGYPGCGKGYDQMVLSGLGLDREKTLAYIKNNRPTYIQFENWVKQQPGVKLDKENIEKLNSSIRGYIHDDETRKNILSAAGAPDDASAQRDAVNLNNLDDWTEFHNAVLK